MRIDEHHSILSKFVDRVATPARTLMPAPQPSLIDESVGRTYLLRSVATLLLGYRIQGGPNIQWRTLGVLLQLANQHGKGVVNSGRLW